MQLFWSSRSPYVRKVMTVAFELGLAERITRIPAVVTRVDVNRDVSRHNPLSQIPTLLLDDGTALYDSPVICEYLDSLHDGPKLIPPAGRERFAALNRQALGDGMMDLLVRFNSERNGPAEFCNPAFLLALHRKFVQAADRLAETVDEWAALPLDIGHVAIATALAYADFRLADAPWRPGRERLAEWHAEIVSRPSFVETAFKSA